MNLLTTICSLCDIKKDIPSDIWIDQVVEDLRNDKGSLFYQLVDSKDLQSNHDQFLYDL